MPLAWRDRVQQTVSAGGTGALTLGAASAGYQALGAADDGRTFAGAIVDGAAWETGLYTYTHATTSLARTAFQASSTGAALNVSTSATWFNDLTAGAALAADGAAQGLMPGGRLTLTSGVPVTIADVTGATTIYYTPHVSGFVPLWDGQRWRPVEFAETALPLGTLIAARPYDVFGYLTSGGALALESLAWTSDTVRATGISIQGGRYCKTGDQTRLYLGTFRTTSTTTTEDSAGGTATQVGGKRFVWNMYNRALRTASVIDKTNNWTYNGGIRAANGAAGNRIELVLGTQSGVHASVASTVAIANVGSAVMVGVGVDSTTAFSGVVAGLYFAGSGGNLPAASGYSGQLGAGYHYLAWLEKGASSGTSIFLGDNGDDAAGAGHQSGLIAEFMA